MKDRIQQIIDYKGISAGDLAEMLDVQRSNISHILNGRNKPGAVFIEKLLQTFPDINARWLLTGEGPIVIETNTIRSKEADKGTGHHITQQQKPSISDISDLKTAVPGNKKEIDKIVLLYSDGTFTYYNNI
jgi:transcriptional regulator with XRE-family HTH domain